MIILQHIEKLTHFIPKILAKHLYIVAKMMNFHFS